MVSLYSYRDKYVLRKIVEANFTYTDLDPKKFPQLIHGTGLYCPYHDSTHTGTLQARIYFQEERNIFYIHCYAEGKNFTSYDYLDLIMCKKKGLYHSPQEFLLEKLGEKDFIAQYNLFLKKKQVLVESQFKAKCAYIDNVYANTGDVVSYIETLYCG